MRNWGQSLSKSLAAKHAATAVLHQDHTDIRFLTDVVLLGIVAPHAAREKGTEVVLLHMVTRETTPVPFFVSVE